MPVKTKIKKIDGAVVKKTAPKKASAKTSAKASAGITKAVKKAPDTPVKLRVRLRAYENKVLDSSVKQIVDTALRHESEIVGPVPLPTEIKKYTVNRSPFIYKNTREQFEIRVHKRMIDILNPSAKAVEALTNLNLPAGVDIEVTMS